MESGDHEFSEELESSDDYSPRCQVVSTEQEGKRLDMVVCQLYPGISRGQVQRWIADAHILIDESTAKSSTTVRLGQTILASPPTPQPQTQWIAQSIPLEVLYEDLDVIVINKPVGLVVHPGAGNSDGTLANAILYRFPELAALPRCGLVHRLDRDTSGVMVVARSLRAHAELVRQLQARSVSRTYIALAWGVLNSPIRVENSIGRDPRNRQKMAVLATDRGKTAITEFSPVAQGLIAGCPVTLVHCVLETGRTHQIRVHAEFLKHPLVGDKSYARGAPSRGVKVIDEWKDSESKNLAGQALHAWCLKFTHPGSEGKVSFKAGITVTMSELFLLALKEDGYASWEKLFNREMV